jgi:hypothetical protein
VRQIHPPRINSRAKRPLLKVYSAGLPTARHGTTVLE